MMDTGVTSDPVPAVVGTRTSGNRGPRALPTPQAVSRSWFDPASRAASLATSMAEPPPKPTTPVAPDARARSAAARSVDSDGSGSTSPNTSTADPAARSDPIASSARPTDRIPGSVTNRVLGPSVVAAMSPNRAAPPSSKTILGTVAN